MDFFFLLLAVLIFTSYARTSVIYNNVLNIHTRVMILALSCRSNLYRSALQCVPRLCAVLARLRLHARTQQEAGHTHLTADVEA